MKPVTFTDESGRKWRKLLPDNSPDSQAQLGVTIGPPDLSPLGLPESTEIRLHNALFDRDIFMATDARRNMPALVSALQAAYKVDASRLLDLYD